MIYIPNPSTKNTETVSYFVKDKQNINRTRQIMNLTGFLSGDRDWPGIPIFAIHNHPNQLSPNVFLTLNISLNIGSMNFGDLITTIFIPPVTFISSSSLTFIISSPPYISNLIFTFFHLFQEESCPSLVNS